MAKKPKAETLPAVRAQGTSRAICPTCFSFPSVAKRLDREDRQRGWGLTKSERTMPDGTPIYEMKYPCSNDECRTTIVSSFPLTGPTPKLKELGKHEQARWLTGWYIEGGLWAPGGKRPEPPKQLDFFEDDGKPVVKKTARKTTKTTKTVKAPAAKPKSTTRGTSQKPTRKKPSR